MCHKVDRPMKIDYKKIETREQLLNLIRDISNENPESWENISTKDFLRALESWLESSEGFYKNFNLDTNPDIPSWQLFADALQAATIYE